MLVVVTKCCNLIPPETPHKSNPIKLIRLLASYQILALQNKSVLEILLFYSLENAIQLYLQLHL